MENGIYIVGEFIGYNAKPWKNDNTRFNHQVSIKTRSWTNDFGAEDADHVIVELHPEVAKGVMGSVEKYRGNRVSIEVSANCSQWKDRAWISWFCRQETEIVLLESPAISKISAAK